MSNKSKHTPTKAKAGQKMWGGRFSAEPTGHFRGRANWKTFTLTSKRVCVIKLEMRLDGYIRAARAMTKLQQIFAFGYVIIWTNLMCSLAI